MHVHVCQESGQKTDTAMLSYFTKLDALRNPVMLLTHSAGCRAVYELTALVAHVVDAAENSPAGVAPEGHLVAHVRVWPTFLFAPYLSSGHLYTLTCGGLVLLLSQTLCSSWLLCRTY